MSEKVYRSELTPGDFLRRGAYIYPEKTAVVYGERRYAYRESEEGANRLASRLRDAGLQRGDRVAFLCPNTPPMLEAHFAAEFTELPKTSTGKVQKFVLRDKEWAGQEKQAHYGGACQNYTY